jgi:ribosomal-protein-alanine N-acetyltransferase
MSIVEGRRDVRLVPMRRDHVRDAHRIDAKVYAKPWSLAMWRQELSLSDTRVYLVAEIDGKAVGHAGMMRVLDEGHVTTVAVDPDFQGHGVASRLLVALSRHAVAAGVRAMTLEVRVSNQRAIALYRRFGYGPAGIRKNYYADENEDGLIMWAHDVHQPAYLARLDGIEQELAS